MTERQRRLESESEPQSQCGSDSRCQAAPHPEEAKPSKTAFHPFTGLHLNPAGLTCLRTFTVIASSCY